MAKAASTANWQTIDIETLHPETREMYDAYKAAYVEMKRIRSGFEAHISDQLALPKGKRVVFGYNFGKLSLAIVDDDAKPKATSTAVSLSTLRR